MRRFLPFIIVLGLAVLPGAASANYELAGHVYCDLTGLPLAGVTIDIQSTDSPPSFTTSGTTDANGYYEILLDPNGGTFQATLEVGLDETVVFPGSGGYLFTTDPNDLFLMKNWVVSSPECSQPQGMCWLTGGGATFDGTLGIHVASLGKRHNFGGNVYPGCSSTAGDGGNWNHIDNLTRRHFQGTTIHVDNCGNVDGIPPGSTSPATPFNFIEFSGSGRVDGVKGNKERFDTVYFVARCEDRNEPGSSGNNDGALIDRYFLDVFTDPGDRAGSTLILVDGDGDPNTVDPAPITDGNLQLHISSCDSPPAGFLKAIPSNEAAPLPNEFWFAASPNPAFELARVRFGLPRDADVALRVFDVNGRLVRTIAQGRMSAGDHETAWDLRDSFGRRVGGAMFFLQLRVDGRSRVQRIVVP